MIINDNNNNTNQIAERKMPKFNNEIKKLSTRNIY